MKGVKPTCNASDFVTMSGRPGYYTPFDDSGDGWDSSRSFAEWVHLNHDSTLPRLSGFNTANAFARKRWDLFTAWYASQRLTTGEK